MLKTLDSALAGAIDIIADDVQATVKSVRSQGLRRTLGDAVEDAAGLVKTGAGTVLSGVIGGKKGPEKISNHAGVASGYADICAGPGSRSMGGGGGAAFPYTPSGGGAAFPYVPSGGAAFPYTPSPSAGKKPAPKAAAGGFAPGIGIQRASTAPFQTPGGVQVFANAPMAPAVAPGPGAVPFRPNVGAHAPPPSYSTPAPSTSSTPSGAKEPPLPADVLAARFEQIRKRDPAYGRCFDCGEANPEWASVSFGVLVCIGCSGHHRQMGTHISRIRSCKMDSWTEQQLKIFDSSGNRHCGEFFAANGIGNTVRFQRYQTPAAEWYREAWIKNRVFGRPVHPPPQGVVAGPCVDNRAESKAQLATGQAAAKAAPPADLLDFGGSQPAPAAQAAQADLLGFGDGPAAPAAVQPANADLLSVAASPPSVPTATSGSGDLLGLGDSAAGQAGGADLFGLAAVAQSARPPASTLASLDFAAPAPAPSLAAAPAQPQWEAPPSATGSAAAANTLAGGARLVDAPKEDKAIDPFAMAMEKWGM